MPVRRTEMQTRANHSFERMERALPELT
jgi:hypothetical protein